MKYLTKEQAAEWAAKGIDWKKLALKNLRADNEYPLTHVKEGDNGQPLFAVMMTTDGLGSSRVFCQNQLRERFPKGYWVAIPERSMGIAIPKTLTPEQLEEVKGIVAHCFEIATTPGSPELFEPEELGA